MKLILLFFTLLNLYGSDASYNRGESIFFTKGCNSCHGPDAEGSTSYPRLANKKQSYLKKRIAFFKAGKGSSVSENMMSQFVQRLSPKELEDLTNFLSNHKERKTKKIDDDILGGVGS